MFKKLDGLLFKCVNLGLAGFLTYGAIKYAPDSPITPIMGIVFVFTVLWSISVKVSDVCVNRKINRHYR